MTNKFVTTWDVTNKFVTTGVLLIRRDCLIGGIIARRLDEMVRGK